MNSDDERRPGRGESPDPERPEQETEERSAAADQPTEESFAAEADLPPDHDQDAPEETEGETDPDQGEPGTDEFFEGIPPEQLPPDTPDLEPEFQQALREAARPPIEKSADPGPDTVEYQVPLEEGAEKEADEPAADQERADADSDDAERSDGTAGERPQDVAAKPVRHVVIGGAKPAPTDDEAAEEPQAEPEPKAEETAEEPEAEEATEEPEETAVQPVAAVAAPPAAKPPPLIPGTPGAPQRPGPEGDPEPPPHRPRIWLRFLIASVVIVAVMAAGTSLSSIYYLQDFANALGKGGKLCKKICSQLRAVRPGEPENILILGSDKRAGVQGGLTGLSDTTILLRLDPNDNSIALMSIPRDLKTYIPGVGTTKFNAAYAYGGPKLTLKVVKRLTGLPIDHVVNVDFLGFVRAVDAIGCVWAEIDRHYYHSNAGLPASLQYSEINIQSGYQKLCGRDALAYVRYRHTDTDLVRSARQQDFLAQARQRVTPTELFITKRDELLNIFTQYTTSDIKDASTAEEVLKLLVASRNAPIKEIHFPGILHPSYVTASKPSIAAAARKFEGIEASGGPRGALDLSANQTGISAEDKKFKKGKGGVKPPQPHAGKTPTPSNDGLVDASEGSRQVAAPISKKVGPGFPVFYPRRLPSGAVYLQTRNYHLHDPDTDRHQAYVEVLQLPQGDYFDVQGVAGWSDPPILNKPSETRTINGREYFIYLDGDRVRLIAWHDGDNSYWVSNTLLQTLTNNQMLGMARSIGEIKPPPPPKHKRKP